MVAARVTDLADAGQILATRTVADMVHGGATPVEAHGAHELRGVGDEWPLFLVAPEEGRTDPAADASRTATGCYRFGRYELNPSAFELRDGGDVVAVEPQVLDVLLYLVGRLPASW